MTKILLLLALLCQILQEPASHDVEVRPIQVRETRVLDLRGDDAPRPYDEPSRLEILCGLRAAWLADVPRWGNLKVHAVTDDGGRLEMVGTFFGPTSTDLQKIDRDRMTFGRETLPPEVLLLEIPLTLPKRSATKITTLEGTITLEFGKPRQVEITDLASKEGKVLEDPSFAAIGTRVTLESVEARSLKLTCRGGVEDVLEVDVVGADGKSLSVGSGWSGFNEDRTYDFQLAGDLPESARVVFTLSVGTERRQVKLSLADVPLP